MPLLETKGAGSAQGYGEFTASEPKVYIEDVFSTYLYDGNGSTQTITNGIDLSGKGGLVWLKDRIFANPHRLYDTSRGVQKYLDSASTAAQGTNTGSGNDVGLTSFSSTGFVLGNDGIVNDSSSRFASWTFRKQPKFFDMVTYTGTSGVQVVSHSLGAVPGCLIMKATSTSGEWIVNHRSLPTGESLILNQTAASSAGSALLQNATSTTFEAPSYVNASGVTYVAYIFAHDAGGFGLSGTDNVISCGSFTTDSNGYANVNLGYEPAWVMYKVTDTTGSWGMGDVMRGMPANTLTAGAGGNTQRLVANTSAAESTETNYVCNVTSTGFAFHSGGYPSNTFIYIAIRRGPMKVPTSGTSVFAPITYTGNSTANTARTTGILTDMVWSRARADVNNEATYDRLRGSARRIETTNTSSETAEVSTAIGLQSFAAMDGYIAGADQSSASINFSPINYINWSFRRAPGFFDVVCYTGTGIGDRVLNHNLNSVPELLIFKSRTSTTDNNWSVQCSYAPANTVYNLNNDSFYTGTLTTNLTSTSIKLSDNTTNNTVAYVAYLFASCPGVSKVGSYTGTGTTKQIDCGFTGGARFVLIKRTDSTGDWYVYDTARGIVAGDDPYLFLNSTAAEVTNTDYVDTYNAGFELSSTAPAGLNANGGTYIFLAIA